MLDQMANEIKLISGSSHPELSALVASRYVDMGPPHRRRLWTMGGRLLILMLLQTRH